MLNVSPNITPVIRGRAIHKDKSLTSLFSVLYSIPFHPPSLLPSLSPLLPFFIILHFSFFFHFISFFFLVFLTTPYIKYSKQHNKRVDLNYVGNNENPEQLLPHTQTPFTYQQNSVFSCRHHILSQLQAGSESLKLILKLH